MKYTLILFILTLASCNYRQRQPVREPLTLNEKEHRGQLVFMKNCQPCHPQGEGGAGWAFPQAPVPSAVYKWRVRSKSISLWMGKMPAFKHEHISRAELNDLVAYLHKTRKNNRNNTDRLANR